LYVGEEDILYIPYNGYEYRLYIKHHYRHPQVTQSVAILRRTDGLSFR